jgi:dTDP-4-dehydrorhamnose reductase
MREMKIVITGANGQLGKELQWLALGYSQFDFIFLSKEDLPIHDKKKVNDFFQSVKPAYCINCAAYTAVDRAETNQQIAFQINAEAVGIISSACKLQRTRLIHISTDYVFNGNSEIPLKEDDPTQPVNSYGASKLKGEELAMQNNDATIIIRTAWLYSAFGNNFVKTMIRLMNEKESINVINDQVGSPTYAGDLAKAIMNIISNGKFVAGIYHYSNEGRISWYDFAEEIKDLIKSNCRINPIPSSDYPTAAKRPRFSLLDKTKIKNIYGIEIPEWKSSLITCINQLKKSEV